MEQTEELLSSFVKKYRLKTAFEKDSAGEYVQECPRIIPGRKGGNQIYEYDDSRLGVIFMPDDKNKRPEVSTTKAWNARREKLLAAGCMILQNCDGEGSAIFDPNDTKQARAALWMAGVRPKKTVSPETRARLVAQSAALVAARNLSTTPQAELSGF